MEVNVKIPKNTYEVPTEVRPDAVQAICEAFLNELRVSISIVFIMDLT